MNQTKERERSYVILKNLYAPDRQIEGERETHKDIDRDRDKHTDRQTEK